MKGSFSLPGQATLNTKGMVGGKKPAGGQEHGSRSKKRECMVSKVKVREVTIQEQGLQSHKM